MIYSNPVQDRLAIQSSNIMLAARNRGYWYSMEKLQTTSIAFLVKCNGNNGDFAWALKVGRKLLQVRDHDSRGTCIIGSSLTMDESDNLYLHVRARLKR